MEAFSLQCHRNQPFVQFTDRLTNRGMYVAVPRRLIEEEMGYICWLRNIPFPTHIHNGVWTVRRSSNVSGCVFAPSGLCTGCFFFEEACTWLPHLSGPVIFVHTIHVDSLGSEANK
jgi:hypothetical protein